MARLGRPPKKKAAKKAVRIRTGAQSHAVKMPEELNDKFTEYLAELAAVDGVSQKLVNPNRVLKLAIVYAMDNKQATNFITKNLTSPI